MGLTSQIKNGGWGALAIYVYSLLVLLYWDIPLISTDRIALVAATVPALAVMFTVVVANDWLNDFWAGGNLKRSTATILRITGENDFFDSAQQEVKDAIDDFDEKGYSHHVSILAGILLAITVPITGYVIGKFVGLFIGVGLAAIILRVFSVRSFRELNQLAKQMSVPYEENYENQ
ncbi:hypothetical protein [Natrinema salsiterrestre]|uniref:Uncharacterized protein n=1 Tax=Natrinema salsiterrestre TaxID=2950540 RepID=A0A9Q4L5B9_9EURY|nr:hypothetical protein [Natrinema salsiterrestre]MDF9747922.1 hypothetical protein [Natrinema salsiterrestre]